MPPNFHNKKSNSSIFRLSSILLIVLITVGLWIIFAFSHISTSNVTKENSRSNDHVSNILDTKLTKHDIAVDRLKHTSNSHGFKYILRNHPILLNKRRQFIDIVDILLFLSNTKQCRSQPVIVTMAHVGSELYWQLYV